MKTNRRYVTCGSVLLMILVLLVAGGCGEREAAPTTTPSAPSTSTPSTPEPPAPQLNEPTSPAEPAGPTETPSQSVFTGTLPADAVLLWEREGGIAGFCDGLTITASGAVLATSCQNGSGENRGDLALPAEAKAQLDDWVVQYMTFEREIRDDAQADAMTVRIRLIGAGERQPDDAVIQEMIDYAQSLYADATRLPAGGPNEAAAASEQESAYDLGKQYLAEQLGIEPSAITPLEATAENWSDACLGLPTEFELCAQVVTPGYRFVVQADGETYEIRTNDNASVIRFQRAP